MGIKNVILYHRGNSRKLSNIGEIDSLKQQLNELLGSEDVILHEGEILDLSQRLDKLIVNYHENIYEINNKK